jgi:hypothetical protein
VIEFFAIGTAIVQSDTAVTPVPPATVLDLNDR